MLPSTRKNWTPSTKSSAPSSRRKVTEFMDDIQNGKSSPLKNITSDYHYHKVEADSEETLDLIEDMLRNKGFLVEDRG